MCSAYGQALHLLMYHPFGRALVLSYLFVRLVSEPLRMWEFHALFYGWYGSHPLSFPCLPMLLHSVTTLCRPRLKRSEGDGSYVNKYLRGESTVVAPTSFRCFHCLFSVPLPGCLLCTPTGFGDCYPPWDSRYRCSLRNPHCLCVIGA